MTDGATGPDRRLSLFEGYGVELEYMIVDARSMAARPLAATLLTDEDGAVQSEVEHGAVSWSNELVSHVLELKTTDPAPTLEGLGTRFADSVRDANARLEPLGCRLLGTGAHPFFDPGAETVIWPGEYTEVYRTYDRIFGVRGHGWANLQSVHLNLPFADDDEFGRLHAAIRLVLPLIPALAASTPYLDGRRAAAMDARLDVYRRNQDRIPELVGRVVPEAVFSEEEYEERVFRPILRALEPHDPDGVLKKYFANSRGAIARFDRGSIEIRLIDLQECPTADLAVVSLIVAVIQGLVEERWAPFTDQRTWHEDPLADILLGCIREADRYVVRDPDFLELFRLAGPATASQVWRSLRDDIRGGRRGPADPYMPTLDRLLDRGPLARPLVATLGGRPSHTDLVQVYSRLSDDLIADTPFDPHA